MKTYNDRNIKEVLQEFVNGHKRIERGVTNVHLREIWDEKLGPVIAGYTTDIKFYQGKLTVKLTSAPLRQELSMGRDKLIDLLNSAIGQDKIQEIVLR